MRDDYRQELGKVAFQVGWMAAQVHTAVTATVTALERHDHAIAERVINGDDQIDQATVELEERCVQLLARQQPVAGDLRFVTSVLRVVVDLERCGDLAVALAKQVQAGFPPAELPTPMVKLLVEMGELAADLVQAAARAWAHRDVQAATALEARDDQVDQRHAELLRQVPALSGPHAPDLAAEVALAGRYLERIADHAVCIGERVAYLVKGEPEALAHEIGP
jgi:phosphate transport system protein